MDERSWLEITPRQATMGVITVAVVGAWLALAANMAAGGGALVVFLAGGLMFTALGLVYWRTNWR